jgi:hypothetical protein
MTPQEKSKDLYDSYWYCLFQSNIEKRNYWSKQCALIAVDEILDAIVIINEHNFERLNKYWAEVKQEIEAL